MINLAAILGIIILVLIWFSCQRGNPHSQSYHHHSSVWILKLIVACMYIHQQDGWFQRHCIKQDGGFLCLLQAADFRDEGNQLAQLAREWSPSKTFNTFLHKTPFHLNEFYGRHSHLLHFFIVNGVPSWASYLQMIIFGWYDSSPQPGLSGSIF